MFAQMYIRIETHALYCGLCTFWLPITGTRAWPAFCSLRFLDASNEYFPMDVLAEPDVKLPADRRYVIGLHPHGIHCLAMLELVLPHSQVYAYFTVLGWSVSLGALVGWTCSGCVYA